MSDGSAPLPDLYITAQLDLRPLGAADHLREKQAIQELAAHMADDPQEVLPSFVDLAMELTGGVSAGLSLYEPDPHPGVFRWRYLRGELAAFENALTPRHFSPCGVTVDQSRPVLSRHPERVYDWISDAGIVVPEVLLVPLRFGGGAPIGTLWIVSADEGHFNRDHARAMTELAAFVAVALRMLATEARLQEALETQEILTQEMSHRVKNVFAVIDGMIRGTARRSGTKEEMAKALSGRLHALASAHTLVSRILETVGSPARASDLGALIAAVVAPHEHGEPDQSGRFSFDGPLLPCGEQAANGVALIFHELATNALKYGALSSDEGSVEIRWRTDHDIVEIIWREQDGPEVRVPPAMDGFGSVLVRKTVTNQLGGELTYHWAEAGLVLSMRFPMAKLNA